VRAAEPGPVELVVSLFTGEAALFGEVLGRLRERFGPLEFLSEPMAFDQTEYYAMEFGASLVRRLVSFEEMRAMDELASIKIYTNGVEDDFLSKDGRRRINIDPGYLTLDKLVLASCKNFSHRIYLSDGVYAELTLVYARSGFRPLEWTYPDYAGERMTALLKEMRKRLAFKTKRGLRLG
jgi:hypothetical protein